jgi:hypothetical protein
MTFQFSAKFTLPKRKQQIELQADDAEVLLVIAASGKASVSCVKSITMETPVEARSRTRPGSVE